MTPQNAFKLNREVLSLTADCSEEVFKRSAVSYQQGYNAHLLGRKRIKPSWKMPVFDRLAWIKGWDDSARNAPPVAKVARPVRHGQAALSGAGAVFT
jgi:hypothetical protein